jgi:hypothetical protein
MPRNNLQVEVNEETVNNRRKIVITVMAPAEDFLLGDLLAQRKAISPCAVALKEGAVEGIKNWWESAEQVIAGTRNEQSAGDNRPTKRDRKPKAPSAPDDGSTRRVKAEPGNSAIAATSVSGS